MATNKVQADEPTVVEETEEERRRRQIEENQAAITLLRSWRETTDAEEIRDQGETWAVLERALEDKDRSYRVRFPMDGEEGMTMATKVEQRLDHAEEAQAAAEQTDEERRRLQIEKNRRLTAVLDEWLNEDDPEVIREQQETWEYLKQALDEDRLSYRKLFP